MKHQFWVGLLVVLTACGQKETTPPEPKPTPKPKTGELTRTETGLHLGQSLAMQTPTGSPVLVATDFSKGRALLIDGKTEDPQTLELSNKTVRGLYRVNDRTLLALESGGDRLFKLELGAKELQKTAEATICQKPRIAEVLPEHVWVVCRDPDANLHAFDTKTMTTVKSLMLPGTVADLAADPGKKRLYAADLDGHVVRVLNAEDGAEIQIIPVRPEPLRMVISPPSETQRRLFLTHAGDRYLSILNIDTNDVEATIDLGIIPSDVVVSPGGVYLYILGSGAGRLLVVSIKKGEVRQSYKIPARSSHLVWSDQGIEGRLLMSSGPKGELWVWRPESENLRNLAKLPIDAAAGRISVGSGRDNIWLISPQSGRAARFRVP